MGTRPRARQPADPFTPEARAYIAAHPEQYGRRPAPEKKPNWFRSEAERNGTVFSVGTSYAIAAWIVATANPDIAVWQQAALAAAYTLVIPAALYVLVGLG